MPLIPIAVVLELVGASAVVVFAASALGIIPTAALMGRATEELAARSGPGIGGLLNVTFGNAPELIIALFALGKGLQEVVKASIVGSIIGNILLVMGAAMLAGGLGRDKQTFSRTGASVQTSMLMLAAAALVMPAIFELVEGKGLPLPGRRGDPLRRHRRAPLAGRRRSSSSSPTSLGLFFSLKTHRDIFNPEYEDEDTLGLVGAHLGASPWRSPASWSASCRRCWSARSPRPRKSVGLSEFFIGVIVVAIVGNAAEHWVAVLVAMKNKMDLAVNIAIGSSAQVALFVAPVLVIASFFIGPYPLALVFNGFELGAILIAILIANYVTQDGESTWFEGVQLLAVYLVFGLAFYFA